MEKQHKFTLENIGDFLSKLAEKSESVYWLSSPDFKRIAYISPGYDKIWGRPREILYTTPEKWIEYLFPEDIKNYHPIHAMAERIAKEGPNARYDESYRIVRPDGEVRWILDRGFPIYGENGECYGVTGVAVDITDQKRTEELLRIAKEKAEAADQAKTIFLANISHDIKTPLAGIIGTSEFLAHAIENPEHKNRIESIVQSSLRLLDMMNEVIDLSRSESTKSLNQPVRFKFKRLIDNVVKLIKPAIEHKALKLAVQYDEKIPNILIGERTYIYRILLNLIANAVKFTNNGSITIKLELAKETDKEVTVKAIIKDTGIGIPKDKQTAIFERFIRLSPSYHGVYEGSGLGLSIVKQFIEEIHGEIQVESEEDKGTSFTCVIPLKKTLLQDEDLLNDDLSELHETSIFKKRITDLDAVQQEKIIPVASNFKLPEGTRILLVEDNLIAAQAVKDTLQSLGCRVDIAYTGYDALSLFDVDKYNLIYMDLGLPDLGGREVTKEIRKIESVSGKNTPIIALSAHIDEELRLSCIDSGMNDVFTKPLMRHQAIQIFAGSENNSKQLNNFHKHNIDSNNSKIIDLELGASIMSSSIEQAKEALDIFMKTLPETKKLIDQAYNSKDFDSLFKAVHKMHGGLSYCGAPRLKNATMNLEIALKAHDLKLIDELYQHVCSEITAFIEAYKEL